MKKKLMITLAAILLMLSSTTSLAAESSVDSTLANGKPVTEENVLELLRQIEQDWPTGTVWGTRRTPGTHKNEVPCTQARQVMDAYRVSATYGCSGYASMVSSLVFGDEANPARRLEDLNQIRPGDMIFMVRNSTGTVWHVTVALESPNEKTPSTSRTATPGRQSNGRTGRTPTAETTWTATEVRVKTITWRSGPGTRKAPPTLGTASWAGPLEMGRKLTGQINGAFRQNRKALNGSTNCTTVSNEEQPIKFLITLLKSHSYSNGVRVLCVAAKEVG